MALTLSRRSGTLDVDLGRERLSFEQSSGVGVYFKNILYTTKIASKDVIRGRPGVGVFTGIKVPSRIDLHHI